MIFLRQNLISQQVILTSIKHYHFAKGLKFLFANDGKVCSVLPWRNTTLPLFRSTAAPTASHVKSRIIVPNRQLCLYKYQRMYMYCYNKNTVWKLSSTTKTFSNISVGLLSFFLNRLFKVPYYMLNLTSRNSKYYSMYTIKEE